MLDFSLVLNTLLNWLSSKYTVSLQLLVSVKPKLTFWQLSTDLTKEMYKNVYCAVFWYIYFWGGGVGLGGWKGTCWELLHSAECEMLIFKCEWLQAFKLSRQLICYIYQWMWPFAVTYRADCVRLLECRDMNMCHEVRSLSTVIQPHTVCSKQSHI